MVKHVYLLGAGFSVPLGGPLFNELLSLGLSRRIDHFFRGQIKKSANLRVIQSFPKIVNDLLSSPSTDYRINLNAEQILEIAEALAHNRMNWFSESLFNMVMENGGKDLDDNGQLNKLIIQLLKARVAIESNHFMTEIDNNSERWDPYRDWYKTLGPNDRLITTNYDLVLDRLERDFRESKSIDTSDLTKQKEVDFSTRFDGPCVAKLHGSCNWFIQDEKLFQNPWFDPTHAAHLDIAIGTPGNSKSDLADRYLKSIWDASKIELRQAEVISIVGYSLPETDNRLRRMLLNCIAYNKNLKAVNIILGTRSERGVRAKSIIKQCLFDPSNTIVRLPPIYAQDFLPSFRPKSVEQIEDLAFDEN